MSAAPFARCGASLQLNSSMNGRVRQRASSASGRQHGPRRVARLIPATTIIIGPGGLWWGARLKEKRKEMPRFSFFEKVPRSESTYREARDLRRLSDDDLIQYMAKRAGESTPRRFACERELR